MPSITDRYLNDPNIVFLKPGDYTDSPVLQSEDVKKTVDVINRRIGGTGESLKDLLEFLFVETKMLFPCNRLGLAFLTDDNERVSAYNAVADFDTIYLKQGYSEDLRGSSLEHILQTGSNRIIHDLEKYLDRFPESHSTRLLIREGIRSSITCPLKVDNRIVGLFFRSSSSAHVYTPDHIAIHLAIAERLSQSVEKAYRIEKLTEAIKYNSEMLGFVSHEIKSPLATTIMEAKMILDNYLGDMDPRIRTRVERIVARSENLLSMVRDFLDLSRLESRELSLGSVRTLDMVTDIVEPVVDMLNPAAGEKGMRIVIDKEKAPSTSFKGNPDMMRIAVSNLVSNAIKYGSEDTVIRIGLSGESGRLRTSVRNDGPGFPKDQIPNLFRKFSRLQTPALVRQKGTGLGLYITWKIVKLHQGTISADSEAGSWACFTIELPESRQE